MEVILAIIELIQLPAIVLGIIALVGLLLQRRSTGDVINGTTKTVLGMLIIGIGIGALVEALEGIQAMFDTAIPKGRFTTFVTFDEAVVSAVQDANENRAGAAVAWTLLFGYLVHIVLARITPFRYLYLTGHMIWVHAGAYAILFTSFDLPFVWVVVLASLTLGVYMTLAPAIAQPFMRRITGSDDIAFGHGQTLLNVFCAWVGKLIGNPEHNAEKLEVPTSLNFFRDIAISTSLVFLLISLAAAAVAVSQAGVAGFEENISDGQNWIVFAILSALGFVAGMLVLLQGVRMLIAEIVPAFRGIGERLIPGARPALDVPVIFPFAPNSLIIGLITGVLGQAIAMILLAVIGWPVPLPSMIVAFFASGAGAIFGNSTGGRRGAIAGGFLWGFVGWIMISFAYKMQVFGDLENLGAEGLGFSVPDAILPSIVIWLIAKLFGAA
jgi:PTS system ascorbate-specific IIC component